MMRLILLGIEKDKPRLDALAQQLSMLGQGAAYRRFDGQADEKAEDASEEPAITLYCWTQNSVDAAASSFQESAIQAKENGSYRGLICDDVAVPEAVQDAVDFRLKPLAQPDDDAAVRELVVQIKTAFAKPGWRNWIGFNQINARLNTIAKSIQAIPAKVGLIWLTIFLVAGLSDMGGAIDFVKSWFDGPSSLEEQHWARIEKQDQCAPFESYLTQFGDKAYYAEQARQRLLRPKNVATEQDQPLSLGLTVRTSDKPFSTQEAALQDLKQRARAEVGQLCEDASLNLREKLGDARFEAKGAPQCELLNGGYRCRTEGKAICKTARVEMERSCP